MIVSIIIPLYNKAAVADRALRSALEQSLPPGVDRTEVVVVDDGSTDGGTDRLDPGLVSRCRVVRTTNQGVAAARNRGAAEAGGELLVFLDADDELLAGAVATYVALARDYPAAGLLCAAHEKVAEDGRRYSPRGAWPASRRGLVADFFAEYQRNSALVNSSAACVRRSAFDEVGGFPAGEALGEDVWLWLELALRWPVAHSGQRVSRVYRDAPNRARHHVAAAAQAPFFLRYFLDAGPGEEARRVRPSLRRLLFHLARRNLLGARANGRPELAAAILACYRRQPLDYLRLMPFAMLPGSVVDMARRLRVALLARRSQEGARREQHG